MNKTRTSKYLTGFIAAAAAILLSAFVWMKRDVAPSMPEVARTPSSLAELLAGGDGLHQASNGLALVNLMCAEGLPGAVTVSVGAHLRTLEEWANRVQSETERHLYRFRARPAEFDNSEGYFRMLMMAVVLYEDFGIRYNPQLAFASADSSPGFSFFQSPKDVFIGGLLSSERTGTCSSMPVLYIAIGRRLGYPLKLVTTKAHLFIRWEGNGERFNVEATGKGMNRYDDEHYKQWPFPVNEEEIRADGYLKSLSPPEELAVFLSLRGHCLMQAQRFDDAANAYAEAARLAPGARGYRLLHDHAIRTMQLATKGTL